ncbi:Hypothetical predicted protein [Scomber scombrus]|uniref:Uncharacterized protein n=1 Tax=Scomber scombrus TaxID=13677 RepID=A0AAV1PC10_SCOSC
MTPALWVNVKGFNVMGSQGDLQYEVVAAECLICCVYRMKLEEAHTEYVIQSDINSPVFSCVKYLAVMICLCNAQMPNVLLRTERDELDALRGYSYNELLRRSVVLTTAAAVYRGLTKKTVHTATPPTKQGKDNNFAIAAASQLNCTEELRRSDTRRQTEDCRCYPTEEPTKGVLCVVIHLQLTTTVLSGQFALMSLSTIVTMIGSG